MVFLRLQDKTDEIEAVVFPKTFEEYNQLHPQQEDTIQDNYAKIDWIKDFFNISDEDLK